MRIGGSLDITVPTQYSKHPSDAACVRERGPHIETAAGNALAEVILGVTDVSRRVWAAISLYTVTTRYPCTV